MSLDAYSSAMVFGYVVIFARIGSALMFMPAFGETQIPMRPRLSFALVVCLAIYPTVSLAPAMPDQPAALVALLAIEVTIGLWMGLSARVIMSALQFAGNQIGQVMGLSNAFGPSFGSFEGATMVATLLLMSTVAMIFATDTHHLILAALIDSYQIFPPGQIFAGDFAQTMVQAGSHALYLGTAISAPFFVMGVILNLGMGLANRMMPQLPVFFVAASLLIAVGFFVLAVAAPSAIQFFINDFTTWLMGFRF